MWFPCLRVCTLHLVLSSFLCTYCFFLSHTHLVFSWINTNFLSQIRFYSFIKLLKYILLTFIVTCFTKAFNFRLYCLVKLGQSLGVGFKPQASHLVTVHTHNPQIQPDPRCLWIDVGCFVMSRSSQMAANGRKGAFQEETSWSSFSL